MHRLFVVYQAVRDEWKRVSILLADFVKSTIVDTSRKLPSFFLTKRIGAPWGEFEGLMKPVPNIVFNKCSEGPQF